MVFYKQICSLKFLNIRRKTPVLESLFNKFKGFKEDTLIKRDPNTVLIKTGSNDRKTETYSEIYSEKIIGTAFAKIVCFTGLLI